MCLRTVVSGLSARMVSSAESALRHPDPVHPVEHLALEVRLLDHVVVDDPDRADAGGREVERDGRTEAAGADEEHAGIEQLPLTLEADLRDEHLPGVTPLLGGAEQALRWLIPRTVVPPPVHRRGFHARHVRVAGAGQELGGAGRPRSGGAVEKQRRVEVRRDLADSLRYLGQGHVDCPGDVPTLPLVRLANVDDPVTAPRQRNGLRGIDLTEGGRAAVQLVHRPIFAPLPCAVMVPIRRRSRHRASWPRRANRRTLRSRHPGGPCSQEGRT